MELINIFIFFFCFKSIQSETLVNSGNPWQVYKDIRLPQSLRPSLYNITIRPNIYGTVEDGFTYDCTTTILLDCIETTDRILLHSVDLNISSIILVNVIDHHTDVTVLSDADFRLNNYTEMLDIHPRFELMAGHQYTLVIVASGIIDESLKGFYYSPYKEDGKKKYIFITMFEPTDARRAFPCFDEPDFKAKFIFNIERKAGLTSLTNLPKRTTLGPDTDGYFIDVFDEHNGVAMSSYLVAFAIGDIGYQQTYFNHIRLRTYSRQSAVHMTEFALEMEKKTMEYFENFFQVKYPLPKEDMIALPTMSFNAMEHWGLITYREEAMLYEEGVSSASDKEWIAILIAHEVSHQWFGNIVSPEWWDDLWLNEGFATYMMFLAVDSIYPDWNMINKMVVDKRGIQNVFDKDSILASHPVYVSVHHPDEINEIFDLISYAKGCAVIRMMNFFLGEATFKNGLTRYLTDFSFKTATHSDLWNSLSKQAHEDNNKITTVKKIMDTWLLQKNYPIVMVTRVNSTTIKLSQTAFLIDANERQQRANASWEIPFMYTTSVDPDFNKQADQIIWLHKDGDDVLVTDESLHSLSWIIGNPLQNGYYRVNYDLDNWHALLDQLKQDHTVIHPINRAQIINDAWNLARAGLIDNDVALSTFGYLDKETDYVPWKAALKNLDFIRKALQLTPAYGDLEEFMRKKLKAVFASKKTVNQDDVYNRIYNSMMVNQACRYGLEECVHYAVGVFKEWMANDTIRVDPDVKETVYCEGVRNGGSVEWEFVLDKYTHSESSAEKQFLLGALACTKQPWILSKFLNTALTSDVFSKTSKITVYAEVARTAIGRLMAWDFMKENWDTLFTSYKSGLNLFVILINSITEPFNTKSELAKLERFIADHDDLGTGTRAFHGAVSNTKSNIDWMTEHYTVLQEWFKQANHQ